MMVQDSVEIRYLDVKGFDWKCSNSFDTMKEARNYFKDVKNDRKYFVNCAESESAPETLHTVQLVKNGEIILEHFPKF